MLRLERRPNPSKFWLYGTPLVAVLLTMIVRFQHTEAVDTRLLFGTLSMPLTLLVALTFTTGMLAGSILSRRWAHWRHG